MKNIVPTPPSFLFSYWKPWEEDSNSFNSYLEYKKDTSLSKYQSDFVGQYVQQASHEQIIAIGDIGKKLGLALTEQGKMLSNKFELGVNVLSHKLSNINSNLSFINDNLSLLVDQQKISNLLLENIYELLRVPDSEKERQLCINLGFKFFVNAQYDEDLFDDALEELLKAENLMRQDYFVLHRIGLIYLNSKAHFNPNKALDYFTKAAKYASVESDPKAINLVNAFIKFGNPINSGKSNDTNTIALLASESYNKSAFVSYVLGDFNSATSLQSKAVKFNSSSENYFMLAKYQARNKEIDLCIQNLRSSLDKAPDMLIATFKDIDLINEPEVLKVLETYVIVNKEKDNLLNDNILQLLEKLKNNQTSVVKTIKASLHECMDFEYSRKLNCYNTSKIADIDNWSFNNLDVSCFRNGDLIPEAKTTREWLEAGNNKSPAWCYFNNDSKTDKRFGKVYNWYAVNDHRGLAPDGLHIPNKDEFLTLMSILLEELELDGKTKNKSLLNKSFIHVINESMTYTFFRWGFEETLNGKFTKCDDEYRWCNWWCSNEKDEKDAYCLDFNNDSEESCIAYHPKATGHQIILVKD